MMTKPLLQEKLVSSYYGPIIASGNNRNNNNKWNEFKYTLIHILSTIIQSCSPLVIMMAILYDSVIVSAVAFGLFLLKIIVLDLFLFKMGKIQNWPNKFDVNVLSLFTLSAILLGFVLPGINIQFRSQVMVDIVVSGSLMVFIAIAWLLFGYPVGRAIVSDKVGYTVTYTHPVVIHFNQFTTGVMLCTFFLNFMLFIAAKVYYDHGEQQKAVAYSAFGFILFDGMIIFIYFYGFYFNTNIEKIAAKYENEINKHHPNNNHEITTKQDMQAIIIHDLEVGVAAK